MAEPEGSDMQMKSVYSQVLVSTRFNVIVN